MLLFTYALFSVLFEMPLTAAAVAGGAVSVPIIIHLLNRRRFRIVEWAAMRFLLQAQKKNSRRMRIEQLLLLITRCLVLLLLALSMMAVTPWAEAVWRWMNPTGGRGLLAGGGTRTHKILVLDGSFSMGVKIDDTTAFERARATALKLIEEGSGNDGYSLILMAAPPRRVIPRPSDDPRKVASEIRTLKMTHGNADLPGTLNTIASLLRETPGKFNAREVYFLTDMQRAGWVTPRPGELTAALTTFKETKAKAIFVDVGKEDLSNLAISGLELVDPIATTATETRILATLVNHGDTKQGLPVRLLVGKARSAAADKPLAMRQVAETVVEARRNQQTPVGFTYRFPAAGDYVIQVQVGHDALEIDDQRSVVVRVRDTVPVMLVNGKPAVEAFDRGTEWLRMALNPFDEGERVPAGLAARPKVLSQRQFAEGGGSGDLTNYDAVFLCDVDVLGPGEVKRLEAHVRRGGAVIVCLGGKVDVNSYNDLLFKNGEGLLPAKLQGLQRATPGYTYQLGMDPEADRQDPLRAFQDAAARERLLMPQFSAFFQTEPAKAVKGVVPRKVMSFVPTPLSGKASRSAAPPAGGGAIWEWKPPLPGRNGEAEKDRPVSLAMRGRVILVTSPVNADWSNWPTSQAFPPLMQELLFYGAAARLREQGLLVAEPIELHLAAAGTAEATIELPRDPNDPPPTNEEETKRKAPTQMLADGSVLRFGETDTSGLYKVTLGQQPREYLFAVNVPAASDDQQYSESNLARTSREELEKAYPEWEEMQVVIETSQIEHARPATTTGEVIYAPQGGPIARYLLFAVLALLLFEVVLAWQFGHYSTTGNLPNEQVAQRQAWQTLAWIAPYVCFALLAGIAFILIHNSLSGDFLAFLPEGLRAVIERASNIPPPSAGEGSRWRLEYASYFVSPKADPWLAGCLAVVALGMIALIYRREGHNVRAGVRVLLVALRVGVILLMLTVFLPQLKLFFERQGWPDLVILIDDSASMSTYDQYRDDEVRNAADGLVKEAELTEEEKEQLAKALSGKANITRASRLRLVQTWLMHNGDERLREMLDKRQVRLHVYRCAGRAQRLAEVTQPSETAKAADAIGKIRAEPSHDSSQLGTAIRQVLNDFRGSSLAGIVLFSDGVTTEGEDITGVSKYAAQMGVPLYFVGVGDSHEVRDLYLHDLQAEDSVFVNDTVIFEVKLTAQGFKSLNVPVRLYEKGKDRELDKKDATFDANTNTVKIQLRHKPTEAGEKVYIIRVPVQEGEVDRDNNQMEKTVYVREMKQIRVLYIEGYRRYEYHYIKTLLEREARVKANKSIHLRVHLLDADADFNKTDNTAISSMPIPFRDTDTHTKDEDLYSYDVVILGDVDPDSRQGDGKIGEHLKNLADFVRERGGGLLMLAGERFAPRAYKNTPLKDVLPIDLNADRAGDDGGGDENIIDSYRMELTPAGKSHPLFRFLPDERENEEIWGRLKEFYWYADGYVPKRAAEVLATHPQLKSAGKKGNEKHPLIVQHFAGAGRCMFFGFDESWRWNWREDQLHFNQFWIQTVRYLARSKVGRIELRLDRQTPYRRGEPIKVTVRFPDDERPPTDKTEVKVVVERRAPGIGVESKTIKLARLEGSRATYDAILTQTPEGEYRFWLSEPAAKPRPQAECKVLAPPGELERLRMNQAEMEQAARATQGRFYTLATVGRLPDELPAGNRVAVTAPGPPFILWNSVLLFLLFLGVLGTEWLLRKLTNLL